LMQFFILNKILRTLLKAKVSKKMALLLSFYCFGFTLYAQQTDSLSIVKDSLKLSTVDTTVVIKDTTVIHKKDTLPFKPKRAALLSTMVPGLGQAFNKQLYKTPIYPGAMVASLSTHLYYRKMFDDYSTDLDVLSVQFNSGEDSIRNDIRLKQTQSRQRANASLFVGSFFYLANIIDAYASAGIKNQSLNRQHSPLLAAYRSAAFPGLGQVYNKQYWKVPVVWAALSGAGFFVVYTYSRRKCYGDVYLNKVRYNYKDEALIERCLPNPATAENEAELLRLREFHKKNLERFIIALGAVYLLNIADAMVYGHLRNFDIDDNLDLSVRPVFHYQKNDVSFAGIGIVLKL